MIERRCSRDEGGSGLGLAIVKHLAQSHGGRVEVESRVGRGTAFRVYLPLGAAGATEPPAPPAAAAAGARAS